MSASEALARFVKGEGFGVVRELLYVSTRKLANFDTGRRRFRPTSADTELKIPMLNIRLGSSRGEDEGIDYSKLRTVTRRLRKQAHDWTATGLSGGDWVRFELRLGFELFRAQGRHEEIEIALFGGELSTHRLLLCGSADHVLGSGITRYRFSTSDGEVLPSLDELRGTIDAASDESLAARNIANAHESLLRRRPAYTHEVMSGHARVIVPATPANDIVLATPLYVQYGSS